MGGHRRPFTGASLSFGFQTPDLYGDKIRLPLHLGAVKLYNASVRTQRKTRYHHGNLREALLASALAVVAEAGVAELSLREVARRAGVSHAAPGHHFADKAGLLTALATLGFQRFAQALEAGGARGDGTPERLRWLGWAYVMFAAENEPYFRIMFRPELLHRDDPELRAASLRAYALLAGAVQRDDADEQGSARDPGPRATAAWAQAHGLATLWLDGNLPAAPSIGELDRLARTIFGLPA
jgi:AcrR family transcriptional regulator